MAKIFSVILIFLVVFEYSSSDVINANGDPYCPYRNFRYANLDNCATFYNCDEGERYLVTCPKGKLFDAHANRCVALQKAKCARNDADFKCSQRPKYGFYRNDKCDRYWICNQGVATLVYCEPGKKFDVPTKRCMSDWWARCKEIDEKITTAPSGPSTGKAPIVEPTTEIPTQVSTEFSTPAQVPTQVPTQIPTQIPTQSPNEPFQCPIRYGEFPLPNDCAQFYECSNFVSILTQCPKSMLFDAKSRACVPQQNGPTCASGERFECPKIGIQLYRNDLCDRYWLCHEGRDYLRYCDYGLKFDVDLLSCVEESMTNCRDVGSRWQVSLAPVLHSPVQ